MPGKNPLVSVEISVGLAGCWPYPDRLPALRLMTPSDYDRAFLPKPFRNCPTYQLCLIIGSSVFAPGRCAHQWSSSQPGAFCRGPWPRSRSRRRRSRTGPPAAGRLSPVRSRAAEKPEEPPTPAERDIDAAIKKVASLKSVTAELLQEVNTFRQKYSVKGSYRKGPNNLVYLRLTVSGLARFRGNLASCLRRRNSLGLSGCA